MDDININELENIKNDIINEAIEKALEEIDITHEKSFKINILI